MSYTEAHRPPRRFLNTSSTPLKSLPEPPSVQFAHHGFPQHHPPHDHNLSVNNSESNPSGSSPATFTNLQIIDTPQPTGVKSNSTQLTLTSSPSFSSKNSVLPTLIKTETDLPTPSISSPFPINNPSNMNVDDMFTAVPFDWDQFLVNDADRAAVEAVTALENEAAASQSNSPASEADTPNSTESEQSATLEVNDFFNFDFDALPTPAGIVHDPSDLLSSFAAGSPVVPDVDMAANPTLLSTFGSSLGDFGDLATLATAPVPQLQLGNIFNRLTTVSPSVTAASISGTPNLSEAYAALGWPLSKAPVATSPAASPALMSTAMKRKSSDSSDDTSVKRSRGRPSSATPIAKRPYRRQSKNGLSLSQLAAAAASGKPVVVDEKPVIVEDEDDDDDAETPVRLTSTGKPSTARPKAVVPEKYMKNGEAQAITGMTTEQILSFPNWAALMACVDEAHYAGAEVFGRMITDNRDKAKWAAKKSRDERKAKVETLEGQVDELQGKLAEMRGMLLGFVGRGLVPLSEVEAFI